MDLEPHKKTDYYRLNMNDLDEIWLSVDLSSPRGTLALHRAKNSIVLDLILSKIITETGDHSECFIPQLEIALKECGLSVSRISRFITTSGPGSFTGLRIALASLKALAYVKRCPIEILSGSEARALKWASKQSQILCDELQVLTHITSDRFASAHFKVNTDSSLQLIAETTHSDWSFLSGNRSLVVLLDDRINVIALPSDPSIVVTKQPLVATDLAEALAKATTRKMVESLSDWVQLVPNYFGSTRF